jgi:GAF domain-containing protein
VNAARLDRLLGQLRDGADDRSLTTMQRICQVCPEAVEVDGAGLALIWGAEHASLAATDEISAAMEQLQIRFGEGPCIDAVRDGRPVLEPDLDSAGARRRWPLFSSSALAAGARAVFGFPVRIQRRPLGALDLYSTTPGTLTTDDVDNAMMLADLAALAITNVRQRGELSDVGLELDADQPWARPLVVHHATGILVVQLGIDVNDALLRLRAHAFAAERSVVDVAGDVVAHRLRLDRWDHETDG